MNVITCFFSITVMLIFLQHHLVVSISPDMQKIALFQFKQSLSISTRDGYSVSTGSQCLYGSYDDHYYQSPSHPKTMNWSMSSDYCSWEGVGCDQKTGNIIGLDLSCSRLEGAILPNSTLFQLSHLKFLNLSGNDFSLSDSFPQEFGFFAKGLTHFNLSFTILSGRVPSGISHLYELVSLDLSDNFGGKQLEDEAFKSLVQNLTQLRVLNLNFVKITSVFPVNFSASLRVLSLRNTGLHGVLSQEVFHLPNLEVLSYNNDNWLTQSNLKLTATLPQVKWGSSASLQYLHLEDVNIYGGIPDSLGYLESLATLILKNCSLHGPIPRSIGSLSQLTYLNLDGNYLKGPIPTSLGNLTYLRYLSLNDNHFTGPFPSVPHLRELISLSLHDNSLTGPLPPRLFDLPSLEYLDITNNGFTGSLPRWLFDHPSLESADLANNRFTGQLYEFDSSKTHLQHFSCRNNLLNGSIPQSFSQNVNLSGLDFSSNNFSGVLDLKMFSRLESLHYLDVSHNSLSVRTISMATLPPNLDYLGLSSCNIKEFGEFNPEFIEHIDLSNNQIHGEIPGWIGLMARNWGNCYLNLSHNRLTGGLDQLNWKNIGYLDLQSNSLNGSLPSMICNSSSLTILNLSHNNLSGVLPICTTDLYNLEVFDMRMNNIQGNIPAALSNFRVLETLNLNGNKLVGRIPTNFAEFDYLKVLDLGSNQINDTFPQCLEALPNLQVLVLKSNQFHGVINTSSKIKHPFPSLRIIDLSYNEFSGPLPAIYFKNFKAMMNAEVNKVKRSYMEQEYYSDSTRLVIKGLDIDLERILTVYTTIDLSKNNFEGEIAEYIGNLVSLRFLNLSHNHLTGHIPPSIGNLIVLESLDLSCNQLVGEIPQQLTGVYSLALLNLSFNQLRGQIPQGSQFNTFENDSYVGNLGLCGHPLSKKCEKYFGTEDKEEADEDDDYFFSGFTWEAVVIGYGCGVVPAFIIGNLMLLTGKPKWFAGIIARELGLKIRRKEIKWK